MWMNSGDFTRMVIKFAIICALFGAGGFWLVSWLIEHVSIDIAMS